MHFDDFNFKKTPYKAGEAYCQSKFANVLFSREMATKLKVIILQARKNAKLTEWEYAFQ